MTTRTSLKWCQHFNIDPKDIIDPDGWDRSNDDNFHYDFNQRTITLLAFNNKLSMSICKDTALEYFIELKKKLKKREFKMSDDYFEDDDNFNFCEYCGADLSLGYPEGDGCPNCLPCGGQYAPGTEECDWCVWSDKCRKAIEEAAQYYKDLT